MIVQIYEIQRPHEAERCIESGVDHIGSVVLSPDEWKNSELKEVILLSKGTRIKNSLIPLFKDIDTLSRTLDYYCPHYVHFCDNLTNRIGKKKDISEFVHLQTEIKEKFPEIGIIRSIPIPESDRVVDFPFIDMALELEPVSDLFLIDTWIGEEPVEGFIGITGKTADRKMSGELIQECNIPVILAGGLSPGNVYDAVMDLLPAGADSCTETNRFCEDGNPVRFEKDFLRVKKFVEEVRRAEQGILLKKEQLEKKLDDLKGRLQDREAALPAHSIRPHQIQIIEELEDEINSTEKSLSRFTLIEAESK